MPENSSKEQSHQSMKLNKRVVNIYFGMIYLAAAFVLMFVNENQSIERYEALTHGAVEILSVRPDKVNPVNNGKIVHVVGQLKSQEILHDDVFDIAVEGIKLKRVVKCFQWKEKKNSLKIKKPDGSVSVRTDISYEKVWSPTLISSRNFQENVIHANPDSIPFTSKVFIAPKVSIGGFTLPKSLVEKIDNYEDIPLKRNPFKKAIPELKMFGRVYGNKIFFGENWSAPQIGDIIVEFKAIYPDVVSIIAKQTGNTFAPFPTADNKLVYIVGNKYLKPKDLFHTIEKKTIALSWVLRLIGVSIMFYGICTMVKSLTRQSPVASWLQNMNETSVRIISFLIAAALSFIAIALIWVSVRPHLAIALFVVAISFLGAIRFLPKHSKVYVSNM